MEAHDNHDNHDGGERPPHDPPAPMAGRPGTPEDCPICFGELGNPAPLCPNGHSVCDICRPHILRGGGWHGPRCPICRAALHEAAGPVVPRPAEAVDPAVVAAARDAHLARVAQVAPNRNPLNGRRGRHEFPADAMVNVGGFDAIGRAGGGRPHNGPVWDAARRRFLELREAGTIPPHSVFGGIHERKCGHRGCQRSGGSQGVRFLLYGDTGKRRYRCEEHTQG